MLDTDLDYVKRMTNALRGQVKAGSATPQTFEDIYELEAQKPPLSPQQQQVAQANNEFQQGVAGRMGPLAAVSGLPVDAANFHGTTHSDRIDMSGVHIPETTPTVLADYPKHDNARDVEVELPSGSVNVFGVGGAGDGNKTWAHEYRHKLNDELGVEQGEQRNRLMDAYTARTEEEFEQVVRSYAGYAGISEEEAREHFRAAIGRQPTQVPRWEYDMGTRTPVKESNQTQLTNGKDEYIKERSSQSYLTRVLRNGELNQ